MTKPKAQEPQDGPEDVSPASANRTDLQHAIYGPGLSEIRENAEGELHLYLSDGRVVAWSEAVASGLVKVTRVPRKS